MLILTSGPKMGARRERVMEKLRGNRKKKKEAV